MKISPFFILSALGAAGVGFAAGWFAKPGPGGTRNTDQAVPAVSKAAPGMRGQDSSPATAGESPVATAAAARVAAELTNLKNLSDADFARSLTDAWLAHGEPDSLLRQGLLVNACDSGKAMAFYTEYKRRKGLSTQQDGGQELREFMTMAGKRYGQEFVTKLIEANPQGVPDLDSLMHGWVMAEPTQAVEWLNALTVDSPIYSNAVQGIVWGLGETAPATAAGVFLKLPAGERDGKLYWSLSSSAVKGHGIAGLNEIAARIPDESERRQLLISGMTYAMREAPADFINGIASHLTTAPELQGPFQTMAGRWVEAAPTEAVAWLGENGTSGTGAANAAGLVIMARQLSQAGLGGTVNTWLAANPQAPGRAAIEAGLQTEESP